MKERLMREIGHEFKVISVLGKGAFGTVLECVNLNTHHSVALKVIKKYKLTEKQLLFSIQESELLRSLDHPNIVKFIDLHHTDSFLILEMELLKGKNLADLLSRKKLTETEAAAIMEMILRGVSHLHKVQVLHRDLKPENIMFQDLKQQNLKITDFGLSTKYTLEERLDQRSGTMAYMAPEQVLLKQYSEPVDIWSCGIILYQLLTNSHPLTSKKEDSQSFIKILQNIEWKFPENFPSLAKDLFLRCTRFNPLERYTANLALQHPFITRIKGKIPLSPLEEVRLYQDKFKLKKLINTCIQLVGLASNIDLPETYKSCINDPFCRIRDPVRKDSGPKKMSSLGNIEIHINEKTLKNSRQTSLASNYGNQLCVPNTHVKKNICSSPRRFSHNRVNSKSISRSHSPAAPPLPKTASKQVRQNLVIH